MRWHSSRISKGYTMDRLWINEESQENLEVGSVSLQEVSCKREKVLVNVNG